MRYRSSTSLDVVVQLLRSRYNATEDEPLPERWVDLINHLNEKERGAADNGARVTVRDRFRGAGTN